MSTLASNKPRIFESGHDEVLNEITLAATTKIYEGAAVGATSSLARPLVAGDAFNGFCTEYCDSTVSTNVGLPTPGYATRVKVKSRGVARLDVTGVTAVTNEGATVYASDDDTFTLTSTSNTAIGKILRWISGTTCMVFFEALRERSL